MFLSYVKCDPPHKLNLNSSFDLFYSFTISESILSALLGGEIRFLFEETEPKIPPSKFCTHMIHYVEEYWRKDSDSAGEITDLFV